VSFHEFSCHTRVDSLTLGRFIKIHLLSLLDGSPHEVPLRKILTLDLGHYSIPWVADKRASGSRIALLIELRLPVPDIFRLKRVSYSL